MKNEQLEIVPANAPAPVTSLSILAAAVGGGINKENVDVVERLIALQRDEEREKDRKEFNAAFFRLRQELADMEFYADKEAKDYDGNVMYTFCSEAELSTKLEPVLFKHGFAMLFGQRQENDRVVVEITLIHQGGHEAKREYSVRPGAVNKMKDATQADAGSTTTAWRNLVIKMFGLKSRIRETDDPRNLGERITEDQAKQLKIRVMDTESNEVAFLKLAGVEVSGPVTMEHYKAILSGKYEMLDGQLRKKEHRGR